MTAPEWFPDWSGCVAVIVASGPSAKKTDLSILAQKSQVRVLAIKRSYELFPGAHAIYGCDRGWWHAHNGVPKYKGLKIAYDPLLFAQYPDIRRVWINLHSDKLLLDKAAHIGSGGNSGFQSLNLVTQFGARLIILVGFDHHDRAGVHWYGRNDWGGGNNPGETNFVRWRKALANAALQLGDMGIDVVNMSPHPEPRTFRRTPTVADALAEWKI